MIGVPVRQFNLGVGNNFKTGFQDELDQIRIKGQLRFSKKLQQGSKALISFLLKQGLLNVCPN